MSEWDLLDLSSDTDQEDKEQRADLWRALEGEQAMPREDLLHLLSGLLEEDILRIRTLWVELAQSVRLELLMTLARHALADFAMDYSAIFRVALADTDADVRTAALHGLEEVEDARLVPEFVAILRHDPAPQARRAAAEGLGKFVLLGELEKLRPEPFSKAVSALRDSYVDTAEDAEVRRHAIESMAYTGDYGVPELIEDAYADNGEHMRQSAVVAMGRSADERWSDIVRRELLSPDPEMRYHATRAAGELQLREAVADLVELTNDADARIQAMALWSLGQIGGTVAKRTLKRFVEGEDEGLAGVANEALQELEFFHGDLSTFFGPPDNYDGETDGGWRVPGLRAPDEDEDDLFGDLMLDDDDDDFLTYEEDDDDEWD
jgi:HEAT repeat protein